MLKLFLKIFQIFLEVFGKLIFKVKHFGTSSEKLPPISNLLLVEPATSLASKIRTKKISSEEVVKAFISRIKEINPILNAVVDERFDKALEEAKEADALLKENTFDADTLAKKKPFFGVPFTIKDSFEVKGLKQTSGSWARRNNVSEKNADAVQLLIDAGAIILCVTNVPEITMWWESYNSVYGRTNNPYDTRCMPGGSSGGEGSNISACGSPFGIGTDLGGSIRMPSLMTGIFGHKPSSEIVSNGGQEPYLVGDLNKYNTTGPMCRYASDLIPVYRILAASNVHLLKLDEKVDIKNLKIYYMEDDGDSLFGMSVDQDIKIAQRKLIKYFKDAYGIQAIKVNIERLKYSLEIFFTKFGTVKEAAPFTSQLVARKGEINVGWELLKSLVYMGHHTMPALFFAVIFKTLEKFYHGTPAAEKYLSEYDELKSEFAELLGDDGIFIYPTNPSGTHYHYQTLFHPLSIGYTAIFNVLGLPATHCPLGLNAEGMPVGIQVVASHRNDHLTLATAVEIEKAFGGWQCPSQIL